MLALELETKYSQQMHLEIDQITKLYTPTYTNLLARVFCNKFEQDLASTMVSGRLGFLRSSHAPKCTWFASEYLFQGSKISGCSKAKMCSQ